MRVVVILGPTGVGKSAVAVELALRIGGEVISADSRAFFRGLDIVADKPSVQVRERVPHHLIDIIEITGSYDAMAFREDVSRLVPEITERGRVPIIAGGGTLYLGAILRGIFTGPSADPEFRARLHARPLSELYAELERVDPAAAARIHPNDRLRIVRALEVYAATGRPISALQQEAEPLPFDFTVFGLRMEREQHRGAITARVDRMLGEGLIDEVRRLRERGLTPRHQAYRTIGVRETFAYLNGELSYDELRARIVRNTWSLARRQLAWFRRDHGVKWIDVTGKAPAMVAETISVEMEKDEEGSQRSPDQGA